VIHASVYISRGTLRLQTPPLAATAFAKRHRAGDHPDVPDIANGMLRMQCYQFIVLIE
jgi:hypothetical protein